MEKTILTTYTLSVAAKTVTLTNIGTVDKKKLMAVINVTSGREQFLYAPGRKFQWDVAVGTNVLTFSSLPSGMADTDQLVIIYDTHDLTMAITSVASSATSVQLLAANAARKNFILENDSTSKLYVKFGTAASTTSCTYIVQPGGRLESRFLESIPGVKGIIHGIWAAANGNAIVSELTQ